MFPLAEAPFFGPAAAAKIIWELFQEPGIDLRYWSYASGGVLLDYRGGFTDQWRHRGGWGCSAGVDGPG